MKSRISLATLAVALSMGSAFAADLPSLKAPVLIPPPPPIWTGFYAGLNAGYGWGMDNNTSVVGGQYYDVLGNNSLGPFTPIDPLAVLSATTLSGTAGTSMNGFVGGMQLGYNYQFNSSFVVGVEADIDGAGMRGNGSFQNALAWTAQSFTGPFGLFGAALNRSAAGTTAIENNLDYIGTVRGRVGYLFTPTMLVYATGGLAYGGVKSTTTQTQFINNTLSGFIGPLAGSVSAPFASLGGGGVYSDTRIGWTVGGGIEWMFMPNWSLKAEYLFYDLGSATYVNSPVVSAGPSAGLSLGGFTLLGLPFIGTVNQSATRVRYDGSIARIGVNYHINWGMPAPVLAKF
jgi:outer membrane immunogenic protein